MRLHGRDNPGARAAATPARDTDPPPRQENGIAAYGRAIEEVLRQGDASVARSVALLAREMAAQRAPLPSVLRALWDSAAQVELNGNFEAPGAVLELEQAIAAAFEQSFQMDRRAHLRLASAYAQKMREVDTLIDSLPALAFLKDAELRYTSVNRFFCEALGVEERNVISRADDSFLPPEVAERFREHDRQVLEGRETLRREEQLHFRGREHTILLTRAPVLDPGGMITGLIGLGFDISERKRLEGQLARQAAALEAIGEAVFITDTDGAIRYVNPAFESMTGFSGAEALGSHPRILKSNRSDAEFFEEVWRTLERGEAWNGTVVNRRKDGSEYFVESTIAPVRDDNGEPTGCVAVSRDITEQKRITETLRQALMVKTEFTSMVSHELRTPLTAIKEAIDLVADGTTGEINENQKSFLALAKRNVDRLHRLINDTLDFSKLERGEFKLRMAPHDLNALAREIVVQQRLAAQKQGIRLELSLDETLGPVRLDPDRISQVLVNLIGNALRYCTGPWIEVSTRRAVGEAIVKVQDSGPGIPEDELERIFNAFVQLSTGPGRKVGGTGLGLAICKRLLDLHGGRIWVESEVGAGSAFYFALNVGAGLEISET